MDSDKLTKKELDKIIKIQNCYQENGKKISMMKVAEQYSKLTDIKN